MMETLMSYLRLVLFAAGVLVGVQFPVFVDQYGKRLEAHYIESQHNLGAFKDEAEKFFNGDMKLLIAHYQNSGDPVFNDGGESIQQIYNRNRVLGDALFDFQQGLFPAYRQAFMTPVTDVQKEVMKAYSYGVKLDPSAMVLGLSGGFVVAGLVELLLRILGGLLVGGYHRVVRPKPVVVVRKPKAMIK